MLDKLQEDYVEVVSNLLVKKSALRWFKNIDSLVLDIDGVILDVTSSFRLAISKTTQFYFEKILKWPGKALLITPEETQLFKLVGGFNNDWELTYAVVIFYLSKSDFLSSYNLNVLRKKGRSLQEFTDEIKRCGGGLKSAEKIALSGLKDKERIKSLWNRNLIKQIFQEFYAGVDWCKKLYGFEPVYIKKKGLLNKEEVIIDKKLVKQFYPKVSIITGRTKKEAEIALERAGFLDIVSFDKILSDDGGIRKPNPKLLQELSNKMKTKVGIYIGDTPDDLEIVNNFKKLNQKEMFLSCIILQNIEEAKRFIKEGVDILARKGNDVLAEIKS
ncbi:HAD-IA family hydrolase [Candidatus Oleimmundimicrobium sp.]|uniref:HAD-IA family hydrolase n=1 Tax=Candidatus Oleimmundimicrobium sp. TaxID=3060597 RepID=UPI00271F76E9|nr:HAD-IA family hydrolase [Candidatus Oleimmundimicrobium sp.]MDO8886634.1 HAD-IA family hydrolase [Candidatus Oleimmundimicrobium sp.]